MSEYTRLIYMQSNNRYNVSTICGIESYKVEPTRTNPSNSTQLVQGTSSKFHDEAFGAIFLSQESQKFRKLLEK